MLFLSTRLVTNHKKTMKRINILCALILFLLTSISANAGVTDGDVTAYRLAGNTSFIVFTDEPLDDPNAFDYPLGAGTMSGTNDCRSAVGAKTVDGLVCNGTSGNPVSDYVCDLTDTPNASGTVWCLFSENPRTDGKAWAVKYVNGDILTNDGDSIVRCKGTDVFYSDIGCLAPPSQISVEGGYIKMDTTDGGAPPSRDCTVGDHYGRTVIDDVGGKLYICTQVGWETITTDP